jgi:hypothetical protein
MPLSICSTRFARAASVVGPFEVPAGVVTVMGGDSRAGVGGLTGGAVFVPLLAPAHPASKHAHPRFLKPGSLSWPRGTDRRRFF